MSSFIKGVIMQGVSNLYDDYMDQWVDRTGMQISILLVSCIAAAAIMHFWHKIWALITWAGGLFLLVILSFVVYHYLAQRLPERLSDLKPMWDGMASSQYGPPRLAAPPAPPVPPPWPQLPPPLVIRLDEDDEDASPLRR